MAVYKQTDPRIPPDLLVYTPEEIRKLEKMKMR